MQWKQLVQWSMYFRLSNTCFSQRWMSGSCTSSLTMRQASRAVSISTITRSTRVWRMFIWLYIFMHRHLPKSTMSTTEREYSPGSRWLMNTQLCSTLSMLSFYRRGSGPNSLTITHLLPLSGSNRIWNFRVSLPQTYSNNKLTLAWADLVVGSLSVISLMSRCLSILTILSFCHCSSIYYCSYCCRSLFSQFTCPLDVLVFSRMYFQIAPVFPLNLVYASSTSSSSDMKVEHFSIRHLTLSSSMPVCPEAHLAVVILCSRELFDISNNLLCRINTSDCYRYFMNSSRLSLYCIAFSFTSLPSFSSCNLVSSSLSIAILRQKYYLKISMNSIEKDQLFDALMEYSMCMVSSSYADWPGWTGIEGCFLHFTAIVPAFSWCMLYSTYVSSVRQHANDLEVTLLSMGRSSS